jgi:hypothetical protein
MAKKIKKLSRQDLEIDPFSSNDFSEHLDRLQSLVGKDGEGQFIFQVDSEGNLTENSFGLPRRFEKEETTRIGKGEGNYVLVVRGDGTKELFETTDKGFKVADDFPVEANEIEKITSKRFLTSEGNLEDFVSVQSKQGEGSFIDNHRRDRYRMFRKKGDEFVEINVPGIAEKSLRLANFRKGQFVGRVSGEKGVGFYKLEGNDLVKFAESNHDEVRLSSYYGDSPQLIKFGEEEFLSLRAGDKENGEAFLYQLDGEDLRFVPVPEVDGTIREQGSAEFFGEKVLRGYMGGDQGYVYFRKTDEGFERAEDLEDLLKHSPSYEGKDALSGRYESPGGSVLRLKPQTFSGGKGELFNGQYQAPLQAYLGEVDFYLEKNPKLREQFLQNAWDFNPADLSEQEVAQRIPVLMHLKASLTRFMGDAHLKRLGELTGENFEDSEKFLRFFGTVSSKLVDQDSFDMYFDKWCALFSQSRGSAEKVEEMLEKEYIRQNSSSSKKGSHYLHNGEMSSVPAELRPYALFFTTPNSEIVREREEEIPLERTLESIVDVPLSALVATGTLNGNRLEGITSLGAYRPLLERTTEKISSDNMNEEIIKTIKSQDATSYIWVRELVQNSRDAIIGGGEGDKGIKLDSYTTGDNWIVSCYDPVGMDLRTVVDQLIVPDRTTKADDDSAGFFGQGFFTVFNDADEVQLRTSKGDGVVQDLTCECVYEQRGKERVLKNIKVKELKQTKGKFKGTEVKRIKRLGTGNCSPELEGTFVSEAVYKYLGAVDPSQVNILYNGQEVNQGLSRLTTRDTSFGKLELLTDFEGLSRLTKEKLFLSDIKKDKYLGLVPEMISPILDSIGLTLDLPTSLTTTRTRNAISNEESCLPEIQRAVALDSMRAYAKLFVERGIDVPGLPTDYLSNEGYNMVIRSNAREDAGALNEGRLNEVDFSRYLGTNNRYDLVQLLTLLNIPIRRKGSEEEVEMSLQDLKHMIAAEARGKGGGFGDLALSEKLEKDAYSAMGDIRRQDADDLKLPDEEMNKKLRADPYTQRFLDFTEETLGALDDRVTADTYYKEEARLADFGHPRKIIYNLNHVHGGYVGPLRRIAEGESGPGDADGFIYNFLENMVHEYTHFQDVGMWSHQEDKKMPESFRVRMQKNMNALLRDVPVSDVRKYLESDVSSE